METDCTDSEIDLTYSLYANMRDGFQRIDPDTKSYTTDTGCPLQVYDGSGTVGRIEFLFWSTYNGYATGANNAKVLHFPQPDTCTQPDVAACKFLQDVDSKGKNRVRFAKAIYTPGGPDIHFAETALDGSAILVKSFNIIGRFPGCLSSDEANPTVDSSYQAQTMKHFMHIGGTLASQNSDWSWTVTRDVGGHNSGETYSPTNKDTSKQIVWDPTSSSYGSWPNLGSVRNGVPDIVARIIFYNPDLFDPRYGMETNPDPVDTPNPPVLTYDVITHFQTKCIALFAQNSPTANPVCSQMYVKAFERGVAFLEFIMTITYSLLYQFNLELSSTQSLFFLVFNNVYMKTGTYTTSDWIAHLYSIMGIAIPENTPRPSVFDASDESTRTSSTEFYAWAQEFQKNVSTYLYYPSFTQPVDSPNELWIQLSVHPMMHAHIQSVEEASRDVVMATYLNNFFQDFSSATNDLIGKTKSYGVKGQIQVQTQNSFYAGPTQLPIAVSNTQVGKTSMFTVASQSYGMAYEYTAKITILSVGALLYIMQNNSRFNIDYLKLDAYFDTNPILPTPLTRTSASVQACLKASTLTDSCKTIMCDNESECVCDYSVQIGPRSLTLVNPNSTMYVNNTIKPCSCLASDAYPQSSQIGRALNPVSQCFANACSGTNPPSAAYCYDVACSTMDQALHSHDRSPDQWYTLFPDGGAGIDVTRLNKTCNTNYVHKGDLQSETFEVNYYIVAGSICLGLAAPLMLALDYLGLNQRRTSTQYWIWLALCILGLALAGLGLYALSGEYHCDSFSYTDSSPARCMDRLTHKLVLSNEACIPHQPLFCQCKQSGSVCKGYVDSKAKYDATCTTNGVCAVCPNALSRVDVNVSKHSRTKVPTTWAYLGVCSGILVCGLLCITLASYFKNLGYSLTKRIVLLVAVGVLFLGVGGVGIYMGMTKTSVLTLGIDPKAQKDASHATKDPCDSTPSPT